MSETKLHIGQLLTPKQTRDLPDKYPQGGVFISVLYGKDPKPNTIEIWGRNADGERQRFAGATLGESAYWNPDQWHSPVVMTLPETDPSTGIHTEAITPPLHAPANTENEQRYLRDAFQALLEKKQAALVDYVEENKQYGLYMGNLQGFIDDWNNAKTYAESIGAM